MVLILNKYTQNCYFVFLLCAGIVRCIEGLR